MRALRCLATALVLAAPAAGDEATADFFVKRGTEALEAGDLEKAEHWVQRASTEQKDYAPSLLLGAEVALRRERREEAIRLLELCLAREGAADLSAQESAAVRNGRERLKALEPARFELEAILDDYVRKVAAVAEKAEKSDAKLARACWESIQLVRPGHPQAQERLAGFAPVQAEGEALLNGKDLEGWNGTSPAWAVRDGVLVGTIKDAGDVNRFKRELAGDYSVVCEARLTEDRGGDPVFALLFGLRNNYDNFGLWVWNDSWRYQHATKPGEHDEMARRDFRNHKEKYDRFAWNTYRVDVEDKRVTAYVNGHRIWSTSGATRSLDGWIALLVQDATVEVRRVQLVAR